MFKLCRTHWRRTSGHTGSKRLHAPWNNNPWIVTVRIDFIIFTEIYSLILKFYFYSYCRDSALGFWHMQSSMDRDNYIKINWENIPKEVHFAFDKINSNRYGTPYDMGSAMHYEAYTFSSNGKPTIEPLSKSIPLSALGSGSTLMSRGDITRLKRLYQC